MAEQLGGGSWVICDPLLLALRRHNRRGRTAFTLSHCWVGHHPQRSACLGTVFSPPYSNTSQGHLAPAKYLTRCLYARSLFGAVVVGVRERKARNSCKLLGFRRLAEG